MPGKTPTKDDGSDLTQALTQAQDRFVAAWGNMGSAWGISRTMAEVHALLFIVGAPLCTDDIMARLQISRGNASMSLRALLDWGIVSRTFKKGDRKEYFQAEQDVWAMFRAIVRERMKREVDPLLVTLHEIRDDKALKHAADADARQTAKRVDQLLDFFQTAETVSQRFISPAGRGLQVAASILKRLPGARAESSSSGAPNDASRDASHEQAPEDAA